MRDQKTNNMHFNHDKNYNKLQKSLFKRSWIALSVSRENRLIIKDWDLLYKMSLLRSQFLIKDLNQGYLQEI